MVAIKKTHFTHRLNSPKILMGLKILLGLICLYFAMHFLIVKGKTHDNDTHWQKAKATNTLTAYQNYHNQFTTGKHRQEATENIVRIKQDHLNYNKAITAGTYQALKYYLSVCKKTSCVNLGSAQKTLKTADKIHNDFKYHLRVKNLSTGSKGYALADIEYYQKIFPQDSKTEEWRQLIGENFLTLANKALEDNDLNRANNYAAKAKKLLEESKLEKIYALIKTQTELKLKKDKPDTKLEQIETALIEGNIELIQYYIKQCPDCPQIKIAKSKLATYEKLHQNFKDNLKNDRLSKGTSHAAANLNRLKTLFEKPNQALVWAQEISDKFYTLATNEKNTEKSFNYINQGLVFAVDAKKLNLLKKAKETAINNKPDTKLEQIETALSEGDIHLIQYYIKQCLDCSKIEFAKSKLATYEKLHQSFKDNLKNDRLSKGTNHAAANLDSLKVLFKNSKQAPIWSQEISDKFHTLAANEKNAEKSLTYIKQGLAFAVNAGKLNQLKANNNRKYSNKQDYENMQQTQTIQSAKNYINNCQEKSCPGYTQTKSKLTEANTITKDFARHLKETALTKGDGGFALADITHLKVLFTKDPAIKQWEESVISKFVSLIDKALEQKKYTSARKHLAAANSIQDNHPQLKNRIQKLNEANPQYALQTKNTKLVPAMIYLAGKKFDMGGQFKRSKPQHRVDIKQFRISKNEISFQKYLQFAKETKTKTNSNNWGLGSRPAINVSWHDAVNYSRWLSKKTGRKFRLPTEAEWEYAASRSNILDRKAKLDKARLCQYANGADKGASFPWKNYKCRDGYSAKTAPTASFKSNAFGLNDTAGNVWEWTYDCWHYNFKGAPKTATAWISNGDCRYRVIKGGGWNSSADFMSPKYRTSAKAQVRYNYVGFRIVEEL